MSWMSIDPGLSGTGWAVWHQKNLIASGAIGPQRHIDDWHDRAMEIGNQVFQIATDNDVQRAYYELPQYLNARYEVNASGDLVKLCVVAGIIAGRLHRGHVKPVRIIDWKGQLSKENTLLRVIRLLAQRGRKLSTTTSHEADSVGIGLYIQGEF